MAVSAFDLYSIGIGPSSSHTVGPMRAAKLFAESLLENAGPVDRTGADPAARRDDFAARAGAEAVGRARPEAVGRAGAEAAAQTEADLAVRTEAAGAGGVGGEFPGRIRVELLGSLGATGRGHASDSAVLLGLEGEDPATVDTARIGERVAAIRASGRLLVGGKWQIPFDVDADLVLDRRRSLPFHPNGMVFTAFSAEGAVLVERIYYSVGGGFVVEEGGANPAGAAGLPTPAGQAPLRPAGEAPLRPAGEAALRPGGAVPLRTAGEAALRPAGDAALRPGGAVPLRAAGEAALGTAGEVPLSFASGDELLAICRREGLPVSGVMLANERVWRDDADIRAGLLHIWAVMRGCVERGFAAEGVLPGGLRVRRRAPALFRDLSVRDATDPLHVLDWVNLYALAVNEENAAGGRVVTAPTNGAAGIIPAVLHYYTRFVAGATEDAVVRFLLTAAAIGVLIKGNASISGAEVGCQGEVGSAAAMAAGALCEVLGGTAEQVENAAEIALEHSLGLTCDPVGGLVQVPCIERNAIAAVKAINAARLALNGDGSHRVSLDTAIRTMRDTGRDMSTKYKETSLGGLAVTVVEC